jgi:hypothetical protein
LLDDSEAFFVVGSFFWSLEQEQEYITTSVRHIDCGAFARGIFLGRLRPSAQPFIFGAMLINVILNRVRGAHLIWCI